MECWNEPEVALYNTFRNLNKLTAYCDQGILIPSAKLIDRIDILDAEWVLVVEKEVKNRDMVPYDLKEEGISLIFGVVI